MRRLIAFAAASLLNPPKRFGSAQAKTTEANVDHVRIALSPHWMIHSSAQGVYVSSLDDEWRQARFTWARRVL